MANSGAQINVRCMRSRRGVLRIIGAMGSLGVGFLAGCGGGGGTTGEAVVNAGTSDIDRRSSQQQVGFHQEMDVFFLGVGSFPSAAAH